MDPKRTWDAAIVGLIGVGMLLMGFGAVTVGCIIACAGVLMLVKRNYVLAGTAVAFILILLCIAYWYPDVLSNFSQIFTLFLSLIFIRDAYYGHRIKKILENLIKDQDSTITDIRIEILSFDVSNYYTSHYHLEDPIRVRIQANAEVIKGIFDVKTNTFVREEPVMVCVYSDIPEKVWKYVGSIHDDGTLKRVEFTDTYEGLVGVDVHEKGLKTEESWRLKKGLYEKWNPVKKEWEPQPGWTPKKTVREQFIG